MNLIISLVFLIDLNHEIDMDGNFCFLVMLIRFVFLLIYLNLHRRILLLF
jgi:hypothetical protein